MRRIDMKDMLHHTHRNRYAVGALDLVSLDFLEGIAHACEGQSPQIRAVSCSDSLAEGKG